MSLKRKVSSRGPPTKHTMDNKTTGYRTMGRPPSLPKQAVQKLLPSQSVAEKVSPKINPKSGRPTGAFSNYMQKFLIKVEREKKKKEVQAAKAEETKKLEAKTVKTNMKSPEEVRGFANFPQNVVKAEAEKLEAARLEEQEAERVIQLAESARQLAKRAEAERAEAKRAEAEKEAEKEVKIRRQMDNFKRQEILMTRRITEATKEKEKYLKNLLTSLIGIKPKTKKKIIENIESSFDNEIKNPGIFTTMRAIDAEISKKKRMIIPKLNNEVFRSHPLIKSIDKVFTEKRLKKFSNVQRDYIYKLRNTLRTNLASREFKMFGGARKRSVSKKNVSTKTGGSRTRTRIRKQSRKNRRPKRTMKNRSSLKKLSRHKK